MCESGMIKNNKLGTDDCTFLGVHDRISNHDIIEKFQTNNLIGSTAYTEYNIYTLRSRC